MLAWPKMDFMEMEISERIGRNFRRQNLKDVDMHVGG